MCENEHLPNVRFLTPLFKGGAYLHNLSAHVLFLLCLINVYRDIHEFPQTCVLREVAYPQSEVLDAFKRFFSTVYLIFATDKVLN